MTTITHEQFEAACSISNVPETALRTALWDLGITIAPPEPPKAMAALANDADLDWDGTVPKPFRSIYAAAYFAALQFAVKVVREAQRVSHVANGHEYHLDNCVRRSDILRKLGAAA